LVVIESDVIRPLGGDGRSAGRDRFFRIGDGLGRLVIDFDQVHRVGCNVPVGGDDYGDGVSDEVDAVLGQDGVVRHAQAGERGSAGDGADRFDVGSGEHGDHAGTTECG